MDIQWLTKQIMDISIDWFPLENLHCKAAAVYQTLGQVIPQPFPANPGTCFDDVFTLWKFYVSSIEHGPFIVDLPISNGDVP